MLAILGLRSLYILLADALHRVKNLQTGLALVLGFVGSKMMLAEIIIDVSHTWSLIIIAGILLATILRGGITDANPERSDDGNNAAFRSPSAPFGGDKKTGDNGAYRRRAYENEV